MLYCFEYLFFKDQNFWETFQNTVFYSAGSVFITIPLALLLALALNSHSLKLKPFWLLVFFSPIVTSVVAAALTFKMILNSEFGLLNYVIGLIGIEPVNWVESSATSKWSVMMLVIWRWTGLTCIYFLAGLQFIDRTLYEAAKIDGASLFTVYWKILLPMMRPVFFTSFVILVHISIKSYDLIVALTQGGPGISTTMPALYMTQTAFHKSQVGLSAASAMMMFMAVAAVIIPYLYSELRRENAR